MMIVHSQRGTDSTIVSLFRMRYLRRRLKRGIWMILGSMMVSACSNDQIPVDARLTITPDKHTTTITERQNAQGRCLYDAAQYVDIPVLLQLNTADGSPVGDSAIRVYVDFAANTYSGIATMALFDDLNSNGVVDPDTELVSGKGDDIAVVRTDRWSGSKSLLLRINLSCSFRGELFAYVDGVSGRAAIDVVAESVEQAQVIPDSTLRSARVLP